MSYKTRSPIPIAEGGTNATSMATSAGVIYYDGSKLSTTNAGISGQVLTSNGIGIAPTYQDVPSGNIVLISTQTANGGTALNFTSGITSTYNNYMLIVVNIDANATLGIELSSNGGSSYITSGYQSGYRFASYNSASYNISFFSSQFKISELLSSGYSLNGIYYLYNMTVGSKPFFSGNITSVTTSNNPTMAYCGAWYDTNITVNAFRIRNTSNNTINNGMVSLYGIID